MDELGKITKNKDTSLETKATISNILISKITICRCKSWTAKKTEGKKKEIHLKSPAGGDLYSQDEKVGPKANWAWNTARGKNGKPEAVLIWAQMWRNDPLEKIIMIGKIEGRGKRGRTNMWWIDFIKETISILIYKNPEL